MEGGDVVGFHVILSLLETIVKNCGDIVHMHVAEKDLLHEMVRIVKNMRCLTEIQNARGIMDVPGNKEVHVKGKVCLFLATAACLQGLRQEVIVDLVEQCRTYKQRVVHLVNSTS
ncbi:target of Myb protein 1 [Forsythia ovata]|uniref:Target of Myb protein 1 n=1 Tax=Forsythia ovata TaxID=205694 RepID=A0ABD1W347_9LAMI